MIRDFLPRPLKAVRPCVYVCVSQAGRMLKKVAERCNCPVLTLVEGGYQVDGHAAGPMPRAAQGLVSFQRKWIDQTSQYPARRLRTSTLL
jgi:acetoin utilization deacetylase AcuC-like enzyme